MMDGELVKALRNNADHYGFVGENGLVHLLTNAADAIEKLSRCKEDCDACGAKTQIVIESLQKKIPRWIPAAERLPEEYVNVLCHLRSLDRQSEYYSIDHLMEDGQWWKAANSWKHEVTHWMPLPQPPTAEEGE